MVSTVALAASFVSAFLVGFSGAAAIVAAGEPRDVLLSDWWWCGGWVLFSTSVLVQWIALSLRAPRRVRDFSRVRCPETLTTQLTELNERGRQYGAQLWQVPFAYVGIVGAVMSQVADKPSAVVTRALVAASIFGIPAVLHFTSMLDGNRRAVVEICAVEEELGLPVTAQYKPSWYALPLLGIVALTIAICAIAAVSLRESPGQ